VNLRAETQVFEFEIAVRLFAPAADFVSRAFLRAARPPRAAKKTADYFLLAP